MKRKSEMDSKAGRNLIEKATMLSTVFSKSASKLLVLLVGFSAMSFVQSNSFVNDSDTNHSVVKAKQVEAVKTGEDNESCCVVSTVNRGINMNRAYVISTPRKKDIYTADRETIVSFINEVKDRRRWSISRREASLIADKEMHFNFLLGTIYPSVNIAAEADREMNRHFADEQVKTNAPDVFAAVNADQEMIARFLETNLYINMAKPSVEYRWKADTGMEAAFEKSIHPVIVVPSLMDRQRADQEMMQDQILNK
ncbi:MAG: hypothetical protein M9904_13000 [Chitinophagaceae bacterium]|nr:hypothetical protein [Chitinophagaceae bacterium]